MKIAALYDIHGNLPALEAVLGEIEHDGFDAIVIGGDVFWGPWPAETLERVRSLGDQVHFVRGNCDRETFAHDPADPYAETNAWVSGQLDADAETFVAGWQLTLELGDICFCHATTRNDTERVTPLTPEPVLAEAISGTEAPLVVCGHTHVQFDVPVGARRLVNAGSVGWAYEGRPGAYWLELGPEPRHRRTEYDAAAAAAALPAEWPGPLEATDLTAPASADEAIAHFEAARVAAT
jgi:putative phosphoesterase